MKRTDTGHLQGSLLRLLDDFARSQELSLNDASTQDQLLQSLGHALHESRINPVRLHGFRVQAMFAYLAAALGNCRLITEEDSGILFGEDDNLTRPDFRVLTHNNLQFLVEVKNNHTRNDSAPYEFKEAYLVRVTRYSEMLGLPLKFAIYWSRWNTWTLVDASHLQRKGSKTKLTFCDALKLNEMGALGDCLIGTVPPLSIRFHADIAKPRIVNSSGEVSFTIGRVSIYSGGEEVRDPIEIRLACLFMYYGTWNGARRTAKIEGQVLDYVEFSVVPDNPTGDQEFEFIGHMSQMVTNQYLHVTSDEKEVKSLAPTTDVSEFGAIIPKDYEGKVLRLWRFIQQPNLEGFARVEAALE